MKASAHLHGHELLHQHSILQVQPLAVASWLDIIAEGIDVDALQLQHGQLDRGSVILELLDIILQPLLVLFSELCVTAAGCRAGCAEEQRETPCFQVIATRPCLLSSALLGETHIYA